MIPGSLWYALRDGDPCVVAMYERHYSAYCYRDGRKRRRVVGPGERLVLMTGDHRALWIWRKFIDASGQVGVNCAVFRNEGPILSSLLIREAVSLAAARWPGERLYTYVDPRAVASSNPGYCFKVAGWRYVGETKKRRLHILEYIPGRE